MKLPIALLLLAIPIATPEIRYFRFERPLQNLPQRSGQACLAIGPEIFAHAAPQLADLRLYRGALETPYALQQQPPIESRERSLTPLNLGRRNGKVVLDAELTEAKYSDVELAISAHDFLATVAVSGSQTQSGSPQTSLGSYTIFDLTRQRLGRSTILHLPESDFRYLHFSIAGPIDPAAVTGLVVSRQATSRPQFQTVAQNPRITQQDRSTILEFSVPAHVPVDRVLFTPGPQPANFSRDARVSIAPENANEANSASIASSSGTLFRVHSTQSGQRIDGENLTLDTLSWPSFAHPTRYTIVIENGDDAPIQFQSVQLQMRQTSLCFDAQAGAAYTLYYGDPALAAPQYDYARLFALQPAAPQLTAGPEQPNPQYQPRPDQRPFTERYPALLWIALVAVIALLAVVALRYAKRTIPPS